MENMENAEILGQSSSMCINIPINSNEHSYSSFSRFIITRLLKRKVDPEFKIIKDDGLTYRFSKDETIRHYEESPDDADSCEISYNIDVFSGVFIFEYDGVVITLSVDSGSNRTAKKACNFMTMSSDISKSIAPCDSSLIVVGDCRSIYNQFGIIKITFDSSKNATFDKLMKAAYKEFDSYLEEFNHNDKYLLLYFIDGRYWDISQKLSKRSIDTIYLPEKDKNGMIEDINKFISPETVKIYERLCITYKRVYLFEGIPGAGKTSFIKALASHFNYNIATLHFNTKMEDSDFLKILNNLPKRTFLLFEDMDCLFKDRKEHDTSSNRVTLSGILNGLDGIGTKHGLICFITTNYKSHLDSALLRPGRVDKIIKFDYVNQEQVNDIYKAFMWECYDEDVFKKFYKALNDLRVKVNVSILTQYLFGYYNNPEEALKNVGLIKTSFNDAKIETTADDTDMYT